MTRAILVYLLGVVPCVVSAQYFGQDKVRHERFDFKKMSTDHFDSYYYPEEEPAVRLGARMAER